MFLQVLPVCVKGEAQWWVIDNPIVSKTLATLLSKVCKRTASALSCHKALQLTMRHGDILASTFKGKSRNNIAAMIKRLESLLTRRR